MCHQWKPSEKTEGDQGRANQELIEAEIIQNRQSSGEGRRRGVSQSSTDEPIVDKEVLLLVIKQMATQSLSQLVIVHFPVVT